MPARRMWPPMARDHLLQVAETSCHARQMMKQCNAMLLVSESKKKEKMVRGT
jgi:hypothetical protein